jgi:hypothetical protein
MLSAQFVIAIAVDLPVSQIDIALGRSIITHVAWHSAPAYITLMSRNVATFQYIWTLCMCGNCVRRVLTGKFLNRHMCLFNFQGFVIEGAAVFLLSKSTHHVE